MNQKHFNKTPVGISSAVLSLSLTRKNSQCSELSGRLNVLRSRNAATGVKGNNDRLTECPKKQGANEDAVVVAGAGGGAAHVQLKYR